MDVKEKKEKENEWIIRQLAIEEEKYYEGTIDSFIPFPLASLLFFVFFLLSSGFYCIVFMWKNPLDGFFFTGMLFTTIEDADTVPKKVKKIIFMSTLIILINRKLTQNYKKKLQPYWLEVAPLLHKQY